MRDLDMKNFAMVEASLKQEIKQLITGRIHLEDQMQEAQQTICQLSVLLRQRDMQHEGAIRENKGLLGTLEIIKSAQDELVTENNSLKESMVELNRRNTRMLNELEKIEREAESMKHRVSQQQQTIESLKDDLQIAQKSRSEVRTKNAKFRPEPESDEELDSSLDRMWPSQ